MAAANSSANLKVMINASTAATTINRVADKFSNSISYIESIRVHCRKTAAASALDLRL